MTKKLAEQKEELVDTVNHLFDLICRTQNSGEVDEYEFSALTADCDDLREAILVFFDKLESH